MADWRDIEDESEKYQAYLASREWGVLKEAVRERSGGICERCKIHPQTATHHLTYKRKYRERLDDLQAICQGCHDFTHGKSDVDPAAVVDEKPSVEELYEFIQKVERQIESRLVLNRDCTVGIPNQNLLMPDDHAYGRRNRVALMSLLAIREMIGTAAFFDFCTCRYSRDVFRTALELPETETF